MTEVSPHPFAAAPGRDLPARLRVLVTGAAGVIGRHLRAAVQERYRLVSTDLLPFDALPGEETNLTDLRDPRAVRDLVRGAQGADGPSAGIDAVVHLGGIADEHTWERIREVNIDGVQNVLEAARQAGVRRVVLASSVHAVGFHPRAMIGLDAAPRPDSFYGVSKVATEALGRLYAEKWGLEVVALRIASFQERPRDRRHLSTWLSPRDMVSLVTRSLESPWVAERGFVLVHAISGNTRRWMSDEGWAELGYAPEDDAEAYASEVVHLHGPEDDITERCQGGFLAATDYRGLAAE
ncbi:MAG: NAD(P)-dependent oxidoreductase [Deltaproteobacteria bacterium]|nr:NAD(P)-dependent oxidoreductase [Deltaproteobacteria bacterium]